MIISATVVLEASGVFRVQMNALEVLQSGLETNRSQLAKDNWNLGFGYQV